MESAKFNSLTSTEIPLVFNQTLNRDLRDALSITNSLNSLHRNQAMNRQRLVDQDAKDRSGEDLIKKLDDAQFALGGIQTKLTGDVYESREELSDDQKIYFCELIKQIDSDVGFDFVKPLASRDIFLNLVADPGYVILENLDRDKRKLIVHGILQSITGVELVLDIEEYTLSAMVGYKFKNNVNLVVADWKNTLVINSKEFFDL
jgi:hypothetical protein